MLDGTFESLIRLSTLGLMLLVAASLELLLGSIRPIWRAIAQLFVLGGLGGGYVVLFSDPWSAGVIVGLVALILISCSVLSQGLLHYLFVRLAKLSIPQWALQGVIAATGLGLIFVAVGYHEYRFEQQVQQNMQSLSLETIVPRFADHQSLQAQTDQGSFILLKVADVEAQNQDIVEVEAGYLSRNNLTGTIIRKAPADYQSNCHGWVYTGGAYWVAGNSVDQILEENGYVPVSQPQSGDLIVYREDSGNPSHTGLVRYVADGEPAMIESKWGSLGVFLHAEKDSPYGQVYTFYRSSRTGHLLQGLPSKSVDLVDLP